MSENPDLFITDHFQSLRKLINLERMDLINNIDMCYNQRIEEVNQIENKCKLSKPLDSLAYSHSLVKIDKDIFGNLIQ